MLSGQDRSLVDKAIASVVIIVALILVLFGGKKIPELMRGMGRGIKEFKDAVNKDYTAETPAKSNETTKPTDETTK